jgi:sugar lactone lactonase YvrE
MSNDKDFKVKNGIQPASYQEGLGTVVSGSVTVGYDLANATYDNVSSSIAEGGAQYGIAYKSDGTRFYFIDNPTTTGYQYNLTTGWDVSTMSYANKSFNFGNQDGGALAIGISSDGTKMYMIGYSNDRVYQYTLSTPYEINTASYDSVSFSVVSQVTNARGLSFKSDGTRMYIGDTTSETIFQYSLSTAWDVSTASYDSVSLDVSTQTTSINSSDISQDGKYIVITGSAGSDQQIYQYLLSTAWDLSTASHDSTLTVTAVDSGNLSTWYNNDGSKLFYSGYAADAVYQFTSGSTLTTNTLDLSTGSVFEITPTSDIQVGLSNPAASGTVSQGTLLLSSEDATGVSSAFSTTLYEGTGSTQTITNGIDLAGDGGMVWIKSRTSARYPTIVDTERGPSGGGLFTAVTNAADASTNYVSQFNSDGFQVENYAATNESGQDLVAWSFKKQTSFFDVVTWTGTGSARTISHALSDEVGMIAVKRTSSSGTDWQVFHRALGSSPQSTVIYLNDTSGMATNNSRFNNTLPTNSVFSLSGDAAVNGSGNTYVAYLFAHDTSATSAIKCGSFVQGTSSYDVDLGFEPQWLLIKSATSVTNWYLFDNKRGVATGGNDAVLLANGSAAEANGDAYLDFTSSGFTSHLDQITGNQTYIYMAIRNPSSSTITYDSTIQFGGGTAPDSPAIGETDVITFSTRDGGTTYQAAQAIDGAV